MDTIKRNKLVASLSSEPEPQLVSIREFFDGNDDPGSIGCNLMEHPGIESFSAVLTGLLNRKDVDAVYAQIAELDPGPDSWPFTDTILVVGSISDGDLSQILKPLEPDEVGPIDTAPEFIVQRHQSPVLSAWWD